ncbi:MAG TPA: alpha/beta fold hydrolase [Xanthomonadales bacterium]|nr:alpha/beta fold hydrolase [Xanthomonadales bacterium]
MSDLDAVELSTGDDPSVAIIWLHGLGADGHDFEPIVPHVLWPDAPAIRFVFPNAPVRPVTLNGGMPMRAWYDIKGIDSDRGHDQAGIAESVSQVQEFVEREQRRGIEPGRVVIAGFSQGGAVALHFALRYPHRLAGAVALSTYLLNADELRESAHPVNAGLPVFVGHGNMDPVVPFNMGEFLVNELRSMDYEVDWHSYPMAHAVNPEEIRDIRNWLGKRLG